MVLDGLKDVSPDSINSLDTDDILRLMNFILGPDNKKLYISVIEILGKKQNIMEINTGVSGIDTYKRTCWAVPGSTDNLYLCTSESCPCKAYIDLKTKYPDDELILCKHLLAIRFAKTLNKFDIYNVTEEQFGDLLNGTLLPYQLQFAEQPQNQIIPENNNNNNNDNDSNNDNNNATAVLSPIPELSEPQSEQ